jgi:hypothetical protein
MNVWCFIWCKEQTHTNVIEGKYDDKILEFCYDNARTSEEIQNHINYTSRSNFSSKILKPLLDNNYLLKLAPNKSKNQKYLTNKEVYNK